MRLFPSAVAFVAAATLGLASCAGSTQAAAATTDSPDGASEYAPA